ncbi:flavin reductase family protein [Paenibacillus arenosi]|uniref:Flavin reductase family protein n=1 Tax=Paenibacillus arenosi TaxID=2774142 RepID=A0ABR9B1N7_9BACL|nr:flavin reductase family protein [Paenibacillus arenosi]MBD8499342.1 flavin reductase family protein [Paenibacillus arenosi]
MISIDVTQLTDKDAYKLLIGSVVPRPIAFITTLSQEGVLNAAPFSYFSIVSSNPPMLSVSVQRKAGVMKDTARNAIESAELVIHIVDEAIVKAVNETAANVPPYVSEVELARLTPIESESIRVPGIAESKIRMECVLEKSIPLGGADETPACDLLIARVVLAHIADDIYEDGRIDAEQLQPVSRMAGSYYSSLGKLFSIERPQ